MVFGGIEAGGTKIVCAIGNGPEDVRAEMSFPTREPDETLARIIDFFRQWSGEPLAAIGYGSFGPLSPNRGAADYGYITTTPKPGWAFTNVVGILTSALGVPIGFDSDGNVAALGEGRWGAAQGLSSFIYITVGTGIGGGGIVNGQLIHGLMHPEMGHMRLPHDWQADPFAGCCPYHGDCLEGLASGSALQGCWGMRGESLPREHPAWELEAHYLALACANLICTLSPQLIILGGGVMEQRHLFHPLQQNVQRLLNSYIQADAILGRISDYIVPPRLGQRAGVLGALALAEQALRENAAATRKG